jgi:RNA polymerase sigma factor for flagellar operon FliA
MDHLWLVEQTVRFMASNWPTHVDRDDLYSAGQIALVESSARWDPDAGVPFEKYARRRIKGAMLDAVRNADWAPRSVRERVRHVEAARAELAHALGRAPRDHEIAELAELDIRQVHTALAGVRNARFRRLDAPCGEGELTHAELLLCPATGAEERIDDLEMRAELAGALMALDERARTVIVGIYLDGRPLADIGDELGVSESRISQIHHETLRTLNGMLRDRWEREHASTSPAIRERRARSYDASVARYKEWHAAQRGRLLDSTAVSPGA